MGQNDMNQGGKNVGNDPSKSDASKIGGSQRESQQPQQPQKSGQSGNRDPNQKKGTDYGTNGDVE